MFIVVEAEVLENADLFYTGTKPICDLCGKGFKEGSKIVLQAELRQSGGLWFHHNRPGWRIEHSNCHRKQMEEITKRRKARHEKSESISD